MSIPGAAFAVAALIVLSGILLAIKDLSTELMLLRRAVEHEGARFHHSLREVARPTKEPKSGMTALRSKELEEERHG